MNITKKQSAFLIIAGIILPLLCLTHLFSGQISIESQDFFDALFNYNDKSMSQKIVRELRIPRMVMALIAGAGLSLSGLLMQTLFNNPLAGPFVLGINSGASLFVAFSIMTGIPLLNSGLGIIPSALIGAFVFGIIILFFSAFVRSHISLLLVGLMLGSFTSAIVFIIQSASSSEELKSFTMWAMGSLQKTELSQLPIICLLFVTGVIGSMLLIKPLNTLVIGEDEAKLLGINHKTVRLLIISITALLTGLITALCGPIAFVGLAIPNLVRIVIKTQNHFTLILASILTGGAFILVCDILIQLLESSIHIPINALTSLVGAPFVVLIVLKRLA
ncbi:MAG: iron ABC transporter permease [Crocinitomicaceae bacterium]|nr:iron ABC transporter permease [Crocinitomicaceae bacterium]MDG1776110.1 iron ABC transporter permease [Crocinitomicaceae bacterium]